MTHYYQLWTGDNISIFPIRGERGNPLSLDKIYGGYIIPESCIYELNLRILTQKLNHAAVVDCILGLLLQVELQCSKTDLTDSIFNLVELIHPPQMNFKNGPTLNPNIPPKINHDLTIEELANEAHLSKFHFQRKFKQSFGLTIGQLKQQEKTVEAKALLEKGKLSTDVAHELGFFDQSHFIKYFKKMWAITPKEIK